jgi:hypothetical protein
MFSMQGLGGRLSRKPSHASEVLGMGGHYLIDERWNATRTCAYWETAISDWWYEEEYLTFLRKRATLRRQMLKSQEFSEETRENTIASCLFKGLTIEKAVGLQKEWKDLQILLEDKKSECVKHKCGAFVLPSHISSKEDVCCNCDCKYQPSLANPIFELAFRKLAPALLSSLGFT